MIGGVQKTSIGGLEVAITGRLACMSREEAVRRLAQAGAHYVATPRASTDLLVFGQGGPPLGDDGRLTKHLRRARELQGEGAAIRVAPEEELLDLLGLEELQSGLHRLYTTEQLGRILGVPRARVRVWVREGLIRPVRSHHRLLFFDFRQVASARTLVRLAQAGVSPARIRHSLEQLGAWLTPGEEQRPGSALRQLEALELSGTLCLRTREGRLVEPSGQLRLDFEGGAGESPPALATASAPASTPASTPASAPARGEAPQDAFAAGLAAEGREDLHAAVVAYRRVLESEDARPEAGFNLGNVLYQLGRLEESVDAYQRATELDPHFVESWNNLGNLLHELGRYGEAVQVYRDALALEPDYADAHYNLGGTLAALGDVAGARRHWQAYLAQDPTGPTADEVRANLANLAEE